MKIAIIFGGVSFEHEISIVSSIAIANIKNVIKLVSPKMDFLKNQDF